MIRRAIASVYPNIRGLPTAVKSPDGGISGQFRGPGAILSYKITPQGKLSYREEGAADRQDDDGDDRCVKGTDCGDACVARGATCQAKMPHQAQESIQLAQKTLSTGQMPSKEEIDKLIKTDTGRKVASAAQKVAQTPVAKKILEDEALPSRAEIAEGAGKALGKAAARIWANPAEAATMVREGFERERAVISAIEARSGQAMPGRLQILGKGLKAAGKGIKNYVAKNEGAEELAGTLGGLTASTAAGAIAGPIAGVAADLVGTRLARKGVRDIQAFTRAKEKLQEDEAYQAAGRLAKFRAISTEMISDLRDKDRQAKIERDRVGDVAGWAIGNAVGSGISAISTIGGLPGVAITATAAAGTAMLNAGAIQSSYDKIKAGDAPLTAARKTFAEGTGKGRAIAKLIEDGNRREARVRKAATKTIRLLKGKV